MYTDTDGIVLRQVKTTGGRRMILLFSRKYGKISAGTNINERGKSKSSLAIRPFTYGRYELFKTRSSYNINGAEVIKSYFGIGENVDRYMIASYVLEFTDKLLPEEEPAERLLDLLAEFFGILEERKTGFRTLLYGYQMRAFSLMGIAPVLKRCAVCGGNEPAAYFSVKDGGIICEKCRKNMPEDENVSLIYALDFGIVDILRYFADNPLSSLQRIALKPDMEKKISRILDAYAEYHLEIKDLKSGVFI